MLDPLPVPAAGADDQWGLFLVLYFEPKLKSQAKQSDQFLILCICQVAYSWFKAGNNPQFNCSY